MTTRRQVLIVGLGALTAPWALARAVMPRDPPLRLRTFVRSQFVSIAAEHEGTWQSVPLAEAEAVRMLEMIGGDDEEIRSELARRINDDLESGRLVAFSGVSLTVTEAAIQLIVDAESRGLHPGFDLTRPQLKRRR